MRLEAVVGSMLGLLSGLGSTVIASNVPLVNAGFEAPYSAIPICSSHPAQTGVIADGWYENSCWADVDLQYSQSANAHSGSAAQRLSVTRVGSGTAQFHQPASLIPGHFYRFSVWIKSSSLASVMLVIRKPDVPYTAYGFKSWYVDQTWRRISVTGPFPDPPPESQALLFIVMDSPGEVFVDDATLEDLSDQPPVAGSLIPNGSFEHGLAAGWSQYMNFGNVHYQADTEYADPKAQVDTTTAASGSASIRFNLTEGTTQTISSPPFRPAPGHTYCASLAVKASVTDASTRLSMWVGPPLSFPAGSFSFLPTEFARTTSLPNAPATCFTPLTDSPVNLWITAHYDGAYFGTGQRTVWVDAAQVEENASSGSYVKKWAQELSLSINRYGKVFTFTEAVGVLVRTGAPLAGGKKVKIQVIDLYGNTAALSDVTSTPITVSITTSKTAPLKQRGLHKIRAWVVDAGNNQISETVEAVYSRLPSRRVVTPSSASYFGVHIPLNPEYIAIASGTGSRWIRQHDSSMLTKWAVNQRTSGGAITYYDQAVNAATTSGLAILGMLDTAPPWASTQFAGQPWRYYRTPNGTAPDGITAYGSWVSAIVGHYAGKIDHWEVWNEPYITAIPPYVCDDPLQPGGPFFPCGTPCEYDRIQGSALAHARGSNGNARILGVNTHGSLSADCVVELPPPPPDNECVTGPSDWTDCVLDLGNGNTDFDVFAFHDYNSSLAGSPNYSGKALFDGFVAQQSAHGPVRDMWNTEGGPGDLFGSWYGSLSDGMPPRYQAAQVVRFDVTMLGAGFKKNFLYWAKPDPSTGQSGFGMVESDRALKGAFAARAYLASLIDTATPLGRSTTEPAPGVDEFKFTRPNSTTIRVLWSYDGLIHQVAALTGESVYDVFGNSLVAGSVSVGAEPVYFIKGPN